MGINVYDVRTGIDSLKGEGITRAMLWPGAGVGGHCLTKDTYHLERGVQVLGRGLLDYPAGEPSLYVLARHINDFMPAHMLTLTRQGLERTGKSRHGAKIALLGWAFIANSDDARDPPSELYRDLAIEAGATVAVHDAWVETYPGVPIQHDMESVIKNADAVVIFTGHIAYKKLNPPEVKKLCGKEHPVIIDGRNVIDPDTFIRQGFVYKGIGRGDKNGHRIL